MKRIVLYARKIVIVSGYFQSVHSLVRKTGKHIDRVINIIITMTHINEIITKTHRIVSVL